MTRNKLHMKMFIPSLVTSFIITLVVAYTSFLGD